MIGRRQTLTMATNFILWFFLNLSDKKEIWERSEEKASKLIYKFNFLIKN